MPAIFQPKESSKARQCRFSLPESDLEWLEAQAKAHGLTIHEAAAQVVRFAREAAEKPEKPARKSGKKPEASL